MQKRKDRAFSVIELAVVLAMAAVACALLLPAMRQVRSYDRRTVCMQNMRVLGQGSALYETQYFNRIPTFSWRADISPVPTPCGPVPAQVIPADVSAAARQAQDLIWRATSPRWDIGDNSGSWFPHVYFSHLVLVDYLGFSPLGPRHVCPEDVNLPRWQGQYMQFASSQIPPSPIPQPVRPRHPFMSNYTMTSGAWAADGGPNSVAQATSHEFWYVPQSPGTMHRRRINEVAYPSQKVFMYDNHARHMGSRWYFFAWPNARQPLLFFDGSVRERRTGDGNRGFYPQNPTSPSFSVVTYSPTAPPNNWESPDLNGGWSSQYYSGGYFRFTRAGLRGRDFDGPEVPWTP